MRDRITQTITNVFYLFVKYVSLGAPANTGLLLPPLVCFREPSGVHCNTGLRTIGLSFRFHRLTLLSIAHRTPGARSVGGGLVVSLTKNESHFTSIQVLLFFFLPKRRRFLHAQTVVGGGFIVGLLLSFHPLDLECYLRMLTLEDELTNEPYSR